MKKFFILVISVIFTLSLVACNNSTSKSVELMGAGDRIHDTFTFANTGVKIKQIKENSYEISGSVDKIENENIKTEFKIDSDINHVVAVKITAFDTEVDESKVNISVNGLRNYDAEHLNGSDYTFVILEAVPDATVTITAKWNDSDPEEIYTIYFSENLELKS